MQCRSCFGFWAFPFRSSSCSCCLRADRRDGAAINKELNHGIWTWNVALAARNPTANHLVACALLALGADSADCSAVHGLVTSQCLMQRAVLFVLDDD